MKSYGVKQLKAMQEKFVSLLSMIMLCQVTFSQTQFEAGIPQRFINYQEQAVQEKIYAHTDKTFYVAGEIIWFKLYLVEGASHKPSAMSKVAYVEVLDRDQKPVLQAKVALTHGAGAGSFMLPFSVHSGSFLLRAYTAWMKNFNPDYFFQQPITIVNTLKRPDWKSLEIPEAFDVQFFPEGGNLVYGLQSKLAFKAVNQYGKGLSCNGILINSHNDTISRFQSLKFGMGHFSFTPNEGEKYRAVIQFTNGKRITKELPVIHTKGYVMSITSADSNHIRVLTTAAKMNDAAVYLLVHSGQAKHEVFKKAMTGGRAEFLLETASLAEGMSHITLFNEAGQPLCERLYFKRPEHPLNISLKTDAATYGIRKKVTLDIGTQTGSNSTVAAELSLAVFLVDSLQKPDLHTIETYLWLTSDLKGFIEFPDYYLTSNDTEAKQALENLLLTQGWRRFQWEDIVQNKNPAFRYLPEFEGHRLSAKITNKTNGSPVPGTKAYLSIPGKHFHFVNGTSDAHGVVHFVINEYYGGDEVIVQTADSAHQINIINPFFEQSGSLTLPQFSLSQDLENALQAQSIYTQTQNIFFKDQRQHFTASAVADTAAFFGASDKRYFLDDYTRFTTMEEVIREYVTELRVRKDANLFYLQMRNTPYKTFFETNPLVLLDGVPVLNINDIMAFDPLKIKTLDVVARKYFHNDEAANGIVSFTTYRHDLSGFKLAANSRINAYNGLQIEREFYTPMYETAEQTESRLPDFRNVLTWSPQIKTDASGKASHTFYTSDISGTYAVVMQGIDKTGSAGHSVVTFTVGK